MMVMPNVNNSVTRRIPRVTRLISTTQLDIVIVPPLPASTPAVAHFNTHRVSTALTEICDNFILESSTWSTWKREGRCALAV